MGIKTHCAIPYFIDLGPSMTRINKREQKDDGDNVGDVPKNRGKRGLEMELLEYYGESGGGDVEDREETGDGADDQRDTVDEVEEEFDEAIKKRMITACSNIEMFSANKRT